MPTRSTQAPGRFILLAGIFAFGAPLVVHFSHTLFRIPHVLAALFKEDSAGTEDTLQLTQEKLETQLQFAIKPERPGVIDLFSISYAPYGDDEVFLRGSSMVNAVIEERFDATGTCKSSSTIQPPLKACRGPASRTWSAPSTAQPTS